jgi:hypothetical protein
VKKKGRGGKGEGRTRGGKEERGGGKDMWQSGLSFNLFHHLTLDLEKVT